MYSEKAAKFCEMFPLFLTVCTVVEYFAKFCGLQNELQLRTYLESLFSLIFKAIKKTLFQLKNLDFDLQQ